MKTSDSMGGHRQIHIEVQPARMQIETPKPKMKLSRRPARMTVENQMPTFSVNWEKVRSESGLKAGVSFVIDESHRRFFEGWLTIADIARRGDRMADITSGENQIAVLARENSLPEPVEVNIGSMPKSLPEVEWERGYTRIDWEAHELSIDWEYVPPTTVITVDPYSVDVTLTEKPPVRFQFDPEIIERVSTSKIRGKI